MADAIHSEFDKKQLPALEPNAMCYMLSKQGNLNSRDGHWHPHVMFFVPIDESKAWGANLPGSPILSTEDPDDHLTIFMIPVAKWPDGTVDAQPAGAGPEWKRKPAR